MKNIVIQRVWNDIRKNGMVILVVALFYGICHFLFGTLCPVAYLFGVPCPGCGLTRAGIALLHGRFLLAAQYNAAIYLWVTYGIYWLVDRYVIAKKGRLPMILLIVVCLLTFAYYIYRICTGTLVDVEVQGKIKIFLDRIILVYNRMIPGNGF